MAEASRISFFSPPPPKFPSLPSACMLLKWLAKNRFLPASQKKTQKASAEEGGSRLIFLPRLVSICTLVKEISHFCIFHHRVKTKCDSPFNIQWIVAKLGRNISLLQANDRPKFHTHSSKRGEVISSEARSGKEFFT